MTARPTSDAEQVHEVSPPNASSGPDAELDLAMIEADLDGVSAALERLDAGTYWSDEITGAPIPDEVLEADPVARRTT